MPSRHTRTKGQAFAVPPCFPAASWRWGAHGRANGRKPGLLTLSVQRANSGATFRGGVLCRLTADDPHSLAAPCRVLLSVTVFRSMYAREYSTRGEGASTGNPAP